VAREQRRRSGFAAADSRADTDEDAGGGADQYPCGSDRYSDADADEYARAADPDACQHARATGSHAYSRRQRFCSAELDDHLSAEWAGDSIRGTNHHGYRE
jgi:hypothetical protein